MFDLKEVITTKKVIDRLYRTNRLDLDILEDDTHNFYLLKT